MDGGKSEPVQRGTILADGRGEADNQKEGVVQSTSNDLEGDLQQMKEQTAKKMTDQEYAQHRADEILRSHDVEKSLTPGTVINGSPEVWAYYWGPPEEPNKSRVDATLKSAGWEACSNGEKMIGMHGGTLYRLPRTVHDLRFEERRVKHEQMKTQR